MKVGEWDLILVAIDIHFYYLQYSTKVSLKWHVKKSHRKMGEAERVGQRITSEVRWDQSHLIRLSSNQAPKGYFAKCFLCFFLVSSCFQCLDFFLNVVLWTYPLFFG